MSAHYFLELSGEVAGEFAFFFGMRQTMNARTPHSMPTTLFALQQADFNQLAKLYPEDEEQITKNILRSWETMRTGGRADSGELCGHRYSTHLRYIAWQSHIICNMD